MSLSKSCFYNDRVSHLAADKTLTDAHFIIVLINAALKSLQVLKEGQPKNDSAKYIKNNNQPKSGPANTIFVCKNSAKNSIRNIHALDMIE